MSINDIPFDYDTLINILQCMSDELVKTPEEDRAFTWYADEIKDGFRYLLSRLGEEQYERFKSDLQFG